MWPSLTAETLSFSLASWLDPRKAAARSQGFSNARHTSAASGKVATIVACHHRENGGHKKFL